MQDITNPRIAHSRHQYLFGLLPLLALLLLLFGFWIGFTLTIS
ncbi:MAG: hypothetical protein NT075_24865 [Chloroflexi bacterium]|nr:hypothetical protein [Chloroflexota bacterium]